MNLNGQVKCKVQDLLRGRNRSRVLYDAFLHNEEEFKTLLYGFSEVLVKKYTSYTGQELEDCHSEVYLYTLSKIYEEKRGEQYDPERGTPFATFIYTFIRNGVSLYRYHRNKRVNREYCEDIEDNGRISDNISTRIIFDEEFGNNLKGIADEEIIEEVKDQMRKTLETGRVEGKEFTPLELAYIWEVFKSELYLSI